MYYTDIQGFYIRCYFIICSLLYGSCYFMAFFVKYFYSSKQSDNGVLTENEKNCII